MIHLTFINYNVSSEWDMNSLSVVVIIQSLLLIYHQITTWFDLSPFNGAKYYTRTERRAETGFNAIMMTLPPIGYALNVDALMTFGVVYYFVLLAVEVIIWWVPYLSTPTNHWRSLYNKLLAVATSNFSSKDPLQDWLITYERIHANTLCVLENSPHRIVPNLEHMILHGWTALAAIVTAIYYFR